LNLPANGDGRIFVYIYFYAIRYKCYICIYAIFETLSKLIQLFNIVNQKISIYIQRGKKRGRYFEDAILLVEYKYTFELSQGLLNKGQLNLQ
jgi:hypothetical protein